MKDPLDTITDISFRLLSTSNPKGVSVCKKQLFKIIIKNDIIKRENTIQQKAELKALEDKDMKSTDIIDHNLTTGVLQVEQRIKQHESSHS